MFTQNVCFNVGLKLLEELSALLAINLVRHHNCSRHRIPIMEQNAEIVFKWSFSEGKSLDSISVLQDLCLEESLGAFIDALKHADIPLVEDARVVDRHDKN